MEPCRPVSLPTCPIARCALPAGLLLAALSVPHVALAQDAPPSGWSLGAAAVVQKSPYRGYDTDTLAVPLVSFEGKSFYLRGGSLGYRLHHSEHSELAVTAAPYLMRFKRKDTDDARLRQLSNRGFSGMLGVAWRHQQDWGIVRASVQADVTGHGEGIAADASYAYPLATGRVRLIPAVGLAYASSKINDYYFGVSATEAARSGLDPYRAGSGVSPYLEATVLVPLSAHWTATASLRRTALSDAVRDSPMTGRDTMDSAAVSINYGF